MANVILKKALGNLIIKAREEAGVPQFELAKKLGFSAQFLGRIEKGNAALPEDQIKTIVKYLGIKPDAFVGTYAKAAKQHAQSLV